MGAAMTLLSPGTALSVENKGRAHRLALCRRDYSIITWHLHAVVNSSAARHCQCVSRRAALSLCSCVILYLSRQLI